MDVLTGLAKFFEFCTARRRMRLRLLHGIAAER